MARVKIVAAVVFAIVIGVAVAGCSAVTGQSSGGTDSGIPDSPSGIEQVCQVADPRLAEISGMAASLIHPGTIWMHNDSGDSSRVFAVDAQTCAIQAIVDLSGIESTDNEAIGIGVDSSGTSVVWLGDIGDNLGVRSEVEIARFDEPEVLTDETIAAKNVSVKLPDGARNAEALLVSPEPNGPIWIISKSKSSNGRFYEVADAWSSAGSTVNAVDVGEAPTWTTDAAYAPDGSSFVLRTYFDGELRAAPPPGTSGTSLRIGFRGQGEAITYSADSQFVYFISEGENSPLMMGPLPD